MMVALPVKTPVSLLQELCVRKGITPKYDLVQIEGAVHEPTFKYRVTVAEYSEFGSGQSKKKAKHVAAKAILDKLLGSKALGGSSTSEMNGTAQTTLGDQSLSDLSAQMVSPYDDGIQGNPVGALQEMCMARRWPPPKYELVNEEGLPHERQFGIRCSIGKHSEVGLGKSKKLAKRQVANKMLSVISGIPMDADGTTFLDDDDETTNLNANDIEYVKILQEISQEQNFEISFIDIEETTLKGRRQCLIQISTLPVAVCYGVGNTNKDAQANAAHTALEYLKLLTQK